ncbi:HlyD family efflux transporter periplasmic adaptor subunit [uncultured Photobacterium sp.]|uniref:HlyD family secretion protein n=1 Tax=uncultured Photobacterium sp. TaxID=173973 RepID=UPI00262701D1|nr:HlyD family efflux transporter periplasmic adaptor subunit [uncultured Photobacterium sp.]
MKVTFNSPKQQDATKDEGVKVPYAPARRVAFSFRWYLILILTFSPVVLLLWYVGRDWLITTAPGIVTTEPQLVVASGEGQVDDVFVLVGDDVEAGTPLMRVNSPLLRAGISERRFQLSQLLFDWKSYNQAKMAALDEEIKIAREGAENQELVFKEYEKYKKQRLVSSADFAAVLQIRTQSQLSYQQALERKIDEMRKIQELASSGPQSIALNEIRRELAELESSLTQLQPVAFSQGRIVDVLIKPGDWVFEETPLLLIATANEYQVNAYVLPKHIEKVQQDNKAVIEFSSGEAVKARVGRGVELADKIPRQLAGPFEGQKSMLKVKLILEEPLPDKLKVEGLPVMVRFN